ncbi:hypothetical protein NS226_15490 [Aureimonas ureilytica]|uniref:Uncharacterized protein n=1 Tax=Aureimonas ureilytica TaxID=401562 RepID=A0A175R7P9_9HYPH|nr:hypothetical protein NS226_15490 [Aureimonas ureilytica]
MSRCRVGRSLLVIGALWSGAGLLSATDAPALQAFGLGLAFPGGGFSLCGGLGSQIDTTALGMGGAVAATFGLALFLWFATGNLFAPPLVWLASAIGAAAYAVTHGCLSAESAWLPALGLASGIALAGLGVSYRRPYAGPPAPIPPAKLWHGLPAAPEPSLPPDLSDSDLARLRFLLDRALQPLDSFDGFERLDPFQSAALRYQLQFAG